MYQHNGLEKTQIEKVRGHVGPSVVSSIIIHVQNVHTVIMNLTGDKSGRF